MTTSYKSTNPLLIISLASYQGKSLVMFGKVVPLPITNPFTRRYLGDYASRVINQVLDIVGLLKTIALVESVAVLQTNEPLSDDVVTKYGLTVLEETDTLIEKTSNLLSGEVFPKWDTADATALYYFKNRLNEAYFLTEEPYPLSSDGELYISNDKAIKAPTHELASFCYSDGAYTILPRPKITYDIPEIELAVNQVWAISTNDNSEMVTIISLPTSWVVFTHYNQDNTSKPEILSTSDFNAKYTNLIS